MQVKDRVVVITAASSKIGAALAQVLARRGAALALLCGAYLPEPQQGRA